MATETLKILAQQIGTTSVVDFYTVPASTSTVVSSIVVANYSANNSTFTIKVAPAGAADADVHHQYAAVPISKNNTFTATLGVTLAATDVVRIQAGHATRVTFTLYGDEVA